MLLHTLLHSVLPSFSLGSVPDLLITGIQEDSRLIKPGNLFIARFGGTSDGTAFVTAAHSAGAVAVLTETSIPNSPVPQIIVPNPGAIASQLANNFFLRPFESVRTLGVTGTNGKTTVTYIIRHILNKLNKRCGMIGTVEIDNGINTVQSRMTTPGAIEVAELLASMKSSGCRACAMEVSSHSLHQHRVAGVTFAGAAFTNLTGDHLDYHKTMDDYAAAKAKLFENLPSHAVAVVNADDKWTPRMVRDCQARIIRFGFNKNADYRARDVKITAAGSHFILQTPDGSAEIDLPMIGRHNIENALAAVALLGEVFGFSVHQLAVGLKDTKGAPGRLQPIYAGQSFAVLVDYAHTDDALENVLNALRPLTKGSLRVVFGCGGDRDRTKRPRMARTAERLADAIYVTSDNPRTESPQAILDEICTGFPTNSPKEISIDLDRRTAIKRVLADAELNDVILIAGKGHENYQIIGTTSHHFDDVEECLKALTGNITVAA